MILLFSILTAALTTLHAKREAKRRRVGTHYGVTVLRVIYFITVAIIARYGFGYNIYLFVLHQALIFGVLFDPLRNHYTNAGFFYLGTEALLDRTFKKIPEVYFIGKVVLLGLVTWLLVIN